MVCGKPYALTSAAEDRNAGNQWMINYDQIKSTPTTPERTKFDFALSAKQMKNNTLYWVSLLKITHVLRRLLGNTANRRV